MVLWAALLSHAYQHESIGEMLVVVEHIHSPTDARGPRSPNWVRMVGEGDDTRLALPFLRFALLWFLI